ncbi:hypothetical protein PMAC_001055 [Pneumocystis sp. 'macacae']|nr:hypothetical protein PMAC_001055 [Pneumocystis sp. 'macacae']
MGLRQLLRREEGRRRRQREKGRQEYRGERANRDVRLSLTRGTKCKKQRTCARRRCARSKEMGEIRGGGEARLEVKSRSNKIEEVKVEVRLALG